MDVTVRRATPSDADTLARASLIASRAHLEWGLYDVALPLPDSERIGLLSALASLDNASFHSFCRRFVAEVAGRRPVAGPLVAGSISAFLTGEHADSVLAEAVMATVPQPLLPTVGAAREVFARAAVPHPPGCWGIELVATSPEARRRGVARALLTAAIDAGRQAGAPLATVMYEIGNERAAAAYGAAGFQVVEERRDGEFERVFRSPGTVRAALAL